MSQWNSTKSSELLKKILSYMDCKKKKKLFKILEDNDLLFFHIQDSEVEYNSQKLSYYKKLFQVRLGTIKKAEEIFNNEGLKYTTIKSFPSFYFVDPDIDILLDDYEKGKKILTENGFFPKWNIYEIREPDKKWMVDKNSKIICHIHKELSWNKITAIDKTSVLERSKTKKIDNIDVRVPSDEDEVLIAAAHSIFENYHIKLSDLIYFADLNKNLDWDYIISKAQRYNWFNGLKLYLSGLNKVYNKIGVKQNIPERLIDEPHFYNENIFPCFFKYSTLVSQIYFRRIFNNIKKIHLKDTIWELYIYLIVGVLWKYYRSRRKVRNNRF